MSRLPESSVKHKMIVPKEEEREIRTDLKTTLTSFEGSFIFNLNTQETLLRV